MNSKITGVIYASLAAITFGLNPLFAKHLYDAEMTPSTVLFYRFILGGFMLGIMMLIRRQSFALNRKYVKALIGTALCLAGTSLGLFFSFKYMDAGIASTILFTYPVIVTVIMTFVYHEKITFKIILSILLSLLGLAVMCKTSSGGLISLTGLFFVIISALAYALYMIVVRQSCLKNMNSEKLTFYTMFFALPLFVVVPGFSFRFPVFEPEVVLNMLGLAFFPAFLSFWLVALGLKRIGATRTALIGALEPLTAVFVGVIFLGEIFTLRLAAGIILILSSVSLVILSDQGGALKKSEKAEV